MVGFSISQRNHYLLLLPFSYVFFSRMRLRGFLFNAASLWVPGLILTHFLGGFSLTDTAIRYFASYLLFISIYETGYLLNDTWGTRHDKTPRKRIAVDYGWVFLVMFIAIRTATVIYAATWMGLNETPIFFVLVGSLIAVIALHNMLKREEFKLFSFLQMSLLRFVTPILLATTGQNALLVIFLGLCGFTFPRFLTYQDSKGRLSLSERNKPDFAVLGHLCFAPMIGIAFFTTGEIAVPLVWAYWIAFGLAIAFASKSGLGQALKKADSGDSRTNNFLE